MDRLFPSRSLVELLLFTTFFPWTVLSVGTMNSLGPMWSKSKNPEWDAREPLKNTFVLCVLESGTLTPSCSGTLPLPNAPSAVPFIALSSGATFTCGLTYKNRKPVCWGNSTVTVPLVYENVSYISLSAGHSHVCALRNTGAIDCWGSNSYNQTDVPPYLTFIQVSSGYDYTCGLVQTGTAVCWGWDRSEYSDYNSRPLPTTTVFSALFSGGTHSCGLENGTGAAVCWGWNNRAQSTPYSTSTSFSSLALGLFHSCGILRSDGNVECWGDNVFSQFDAPKDEAFSVIAAGDYYTCGVSLKTPNSVRCWGNSVDFTGAAQSIKVSQGLCQSKECSLDQYQLSEKCPDAVDRICVDCTERNCLGTKGGTKGKTVAVGIGVGLVILFAACGTVTSYYYFCYRRRKSTTSVAVEQHQAWTSFANRLVSFNSSDLVTATKNYSPDMIIGRGSCGVVYKAVLPDGRELALKKSGAGDTTLVKELTLLARLHHTYLVNLVGYCSQEKLLAFEFMENGSLYDCLFKNPVRLDLFKRIRIAAQAARGLEYLHVYASPQIIHRDVKAANVLVDRDWNAHLSDFGFSRLSSSAGNTDVMTIVGTRGYMDPELIQTGTFTTKSDVYSFGVLLLELLTGRPAMLSSSKTLAGLVLEHSTSNSLWLFDPIIYGPVNAEPLEEVFNLALRCISLEEENRPDISYTANALEQILKTTLIPPDEESRSSYPFSSSSSLIPPDEESRNSYPFSSTSSRL